MKFNLLFILFLTACQAEIPTKVEHTGTVTTRNIIEIQITIPETLLQTFDTVCQDKCNGDKTCVNSCNAEQQATYTNQILALISQFQQIAVSSATGEK